LARRDLHQCCRRQLECREQLDVARGAGGTDDALISNAGTYTVTLSDTEGPNSITLNDANATLSVTSSGIVLGSPMTLDAGALALSGIIIGSTVVNSGGVFLPNGGTLDGVTWQGPLAGMAGSGFYSLNIKDGITLENLAGTGPGTLDMGNLYVVNIVDSTPLANMVINFNFFNSIFLNGPASGALIVASTMTINQSQAGAAGEITGAALNNSGTISLTASGSTPLIASTSFSNAGTLAVGGGDHATVANGFSNTGAVAVSSAGKLMFTTSNNSILSNAATIDVASAGSLVVGASLAGSGEITLATFGVADMFDTGNTVVFQDGKGTLRLEAPATFGGHIAGFQKGDKIDLPGQAVTKVSYGGSTTAGGVLTVDNGTTVVASLNLLGNYTTGFTFGFTTDGGTGNDITVACYAEGTCIRTTTGEIAVEALRVGDRLPVVLGGRWARVRWIGHRRVDCRRHPKPEEVWPVRVQAGAFGTGAPHRDLLLSPDHAVLVGGVLIPIRYLMNGATIAQEPLDSVSYWHVELRRHGVILAEGLPCESFLDTGNRGAFENGGAVVQAHPDFALGVWKRRSCAPLVLSGPVLTAAKARLLARANALGFTLTTNPHLRLIVDGRAVRAAVAGSTWRFVLPGGAREIRLASRSVVPAFVSAQNTDHRRIGVAVARLRVDGEAVPPGDPRRASGWHEAEGEWQWTNGDAGLACAGARRVEVTLVLFLRYWDTDARPRDDVTTATR
jgi:hypothetical protein